MHLSLLITSGTTVEAIRKLNVQYKYLCWGITNNTIESNFKELTLNPISQQIRNFLYHLMQKIIAGIGL